MSHPIAAFREVFGKPGYLALGTVVALLSAILLAWSGQVVTVFPQGGVYFDAGTVSLVGLGVAAILLGLTLPLHWYAWRRARRSRTAGGVGIVGAIFSVGSLSCCAPLLVPGLLSLVGFGGADLLTLNIRLHQLRGPLTLVAIVFLLASLAMALQQVAASCKTR